MLARQETLLKVLDKMTEGALVIDRDWRILYANESARHYLGLTPDEEQIGPDLIPVLSGRFDLSMPLGGREEDSEKSMVFEAQDRPGVSQGTMLSIYMSRTSEEGWRIFLMRDILQEVREHKLKGDFLNLISHKFRTPVTVLKMGMYNLIHGNYGALTQKQREAVQKIQARVDDLESIINRLITFTSLQDEHITHEKVPMDVIKLAHSYCADFTRRNTAKKIRCSCGEIPDNARATVNDRLFGILIENILDNAVKFSDKPEIHVSFSAHRHDVTGELIVEITDDGPGIPPAVLKNVFQAFTQRDDDYTGSVEGLGLGLPTIMHLMQLFGGSAELDSGPTKGTTVRLIFPSVSGGDEDDDERSFSVSFDPSSL